MDSFVSFRQRSPVSVVNDEISFLKICVSLIKNLQKARSWLYILYMNNQNTLIVVDMQEGFVDTWTCTPFIDRCRWILIKNVKMAAEQVLDEWWTVIRINYEWYGATIDELSFLDKASPAIVPLIKRLNSIFHPFDGNEEYVASAMPYMDRALQWDMISVVWVNASYCVLYNAADIRNRRKTIPRFIERPELAQRYYATWFSGENASNFQASIVTRRNAILNLDNAKPNTTDQGFIHENSTRIRYDFEREVCELEWEYIVLNN